MLHNIAMIFHNIAVNVVYTKESVDLIILLLQHIVNILYPNTILY